MTNDEVLAAFGIAPDGLTMLEQRTHDSSSAVDDNVPEYCALERGEVHPLGISITLYDPTGLQAHIAALLAQAEADHQPRDFMWGGRPFTGTVGEVVWQRNGTMVAYMMDFRPAEAAA